MGTIIGESFLAAPAKAQGVPQAEEITKVDVQKVAAGYTQEDADACTPDAMRLCQQAIPDESRVALCLVQNKRQLSPACTIVFTTTIRGMSPNWRDVPIGDFAPIVQNNKRATLADAVHCRTLRFRRNRPANL